MQPSFVAFASKSKAGARFSEQFETSLKRETDEGEVNVNRTSTSGSKIHLPVGCSTSRNGTRTTDRKAKTVTVQHVAAAR